MDTSPEQSRGTTRLALSDGDRRFLLVVGALAGGALGAALPWLAGLVGRFPVPFGAVVESLGGAVFPGDAVVRPLVGAALGALAGLALARTTVVLEVDDHDVRVVRGRDTRRLPRAEVAGVFREGRHLVIETAQGRRLLDESVEGGRERVRDAFVEHGYPWELADDR